MAFRFNPCQPCCARCEMFPHDQFILQLPYMQDGAVHGCTNLNGSYLCKFLFSEIREGFFLADGNSSGPRFGRCVWLSAPASYPFENYMFAVTRITQDGQYGITPNSNYLWYVLLTSGDPAYIPELPISIGGGYTTPWRVGGATFGMPILSFAQSQFHGSEPVANQIEIPSPITTSTFGGIPDGVPYAANCLQPFYQTSANIVLP